MNTLFDIPYSPSPKLAWLRKHNLETAYDSGLVDVYGEKEPWSCYKFNSDNMTIGETEIEAILRYCEKYNLKHWSLE